MLLITELYEDTQYITEKSEDGKKNHYIQGRFIVAEEKNKNGRIYPKHVLEKEVDRFVREMVNTKRALGELNHPSGPTINLDRVSHIITELKWDGNVVNGKARITETPMGNIVMGLLGSGWQGGVSTRGMGSLKESNGTMIVQPDFKLSTVDIVADPSAPGCWVNGIMENVNWFYDEKMGWKSQEVAEQTKNLVKTLSKRELEEKTIKLFEDYIQTLLVK